MTITPIGPAPSAAKTEAPAGSGKAGDGGFGALLAQLAAPAPDAAGEVVEPGVEGEVVDPELAALAQLVGATPAANPALASAAAPGSPVAGGQGLAETAVRGVAGVAVDGAAAAAAPLPAALGQAGQAPEGALQAGQQGRTGQAAADTLVAGGDAGLVDPLPGTDPASDVDGADPAASLPGEAEEVPTTKVVATAATDTGADGHTPGQSTPNAAVVTTGAATAAAAAAPVADAGQVTPSRLLDQVTPVVSRMVSAGEGSHRMVLRLHPADLGEVQLTVTVRGGTVDVTVAAGNEARELMASGSSELRALLDSIGRTAGQITFKELPGVAQLPPLATGLPPGAQDSGQSGTTYAGTDADRDGGGRGDGAQHSGPDPRAGHRADLPDGTTPPTRSPGSGALDVTI